MWNLLTSLDAGAALLSLTALEIVLGIDNVVFISILVRASTGMAKRRALGLALALRDRAAVCADSLLGLSERYSPLG